MFVVKKIFDIIGLFIVAIKVKDKKGDKNLSKNNLLGMDIQELNRVVKNYRQPKYRGKQLFQWIYKGINSIDEITNLPNDFKEKLDKEYYIFRLKIVEKYQGIDGRTIKFLFALEDDNIIESVVMKYNYGNTICISTQVGCRMGCSFCASTLDGKTRNLSAGEMLDQVLKAQEVIGERISNIVLMGSGEPLDNMEEVLKFLHLVNHPDSLNIGQRHITLSTCGLVPEIIQLADENLQINLSISLHASNDIQRMEIMPIAKKYKLDELMKACQYYIKKTNRRITFEYALIHDKNDQIRDAEILGSLLKGLLCHVNLIPINPIKERDFQQSTKGQIQVFKEKLESFKIPTTIRKEMGSNINAACGQLRKGYLDSMKK